jgi:N-acetylmuramoyl-L-alanine amidase
MSICFIVGHGKSKAGGYDSGAVSKDKKWHEFKIAREIAKFAYEHWLATYAEDCDLMNYDGSLYLTDRIKAANKAKYDFVAEIHLNAGGGTGSEVYYSNTSATGKKIAAAISAAIAGAFGVRNRGAKIKLNSAGADYFGIIRQTNMQAVLIETLFIDTDDLNKLTTAAGQKKCGVAIADSIAAARGIGKKTSGDSNKAVTTVHLVEITASSLRIREKPSTLSKTKGFVKKGQVFTIVETNGNWGKLKSGAGWISLKYTQRI